MGEAQSNSGAANGAMVPAGVVAREEGIGTRELARTAETASIAVAAQAKAAIEARYVMALQRPRDWDMVRDRLLRECRRPGFAEVARFAKPIGKEKGPDGWQDKFARGFSIRFAEAAVRCATNILIEEMTIYDDAHKRIVRVTVTDLEANVCYPKDITIEKSVERSKPREGQEVISTRTNSRGHQTFLVRATEDDLLNKQGALVSKSMRNALRLIPGDILDDCEAEIYKTLQAKDAQDPAAARKRLADSFSAIGVSPADLKSYLGHPLDGCSPAELQHLRDIYQAIRDGETTWKDAADSGKGSPEATDAKDAKAAGSVSEKIAEKRKAAAAQKTAAPPPADDGTPSPEEQREIAEQEAAEAKAQRG